MRKIAVLLFMVIAVLSAFTSCEVFEARKEGKVVILSVGLDYSGMYMRDSNGVENAVSVLRGTINDTTETGMALKSLYDTRGIECSLTYLLQIGSTIPVTDKLYASYAHVKENLNSIKSGLDKNDLFIFYYSGHGETGKGGEMFLALGDSYDKIRYKEFYMEELEKILLEFPCRTVVILDSCHSGMFDTSSVTPNTFASSLSEINGYDWLDDNRLTVLAASKGRETSLDATLVYNGSENEVHGPFTTALLASLGWKHTADSVEYGGAKVKGQSVGRRGTLTMDSLYREILATMDKLSGYKHQTPQLYGTLEEVKILP